MTGTLFTAALAWAALLSAETVTTCGTWTERTSYLMGTTLTARVCVSDPIVGRRELESVFAEVRRVERVLSTWDPTAELARVNTQTAPRVALSPELADLVGEAAAWSRATNGAFDPAVGALLDAWGFRGTPRVPSGDVLVRALAATGVARVQFDSCAIAARPAGWWLDSGGFGKGAALRSAERLLRGANVREAVLDFGGQLLVIGSAQISVAHPADRQTPVISFRAENVSVSTSAQSERYIEIGGKSYGHILDPRTGYPVEAWGSVTVVTKDAFAADALSTALFVMGPEQALQWAAQHPEVGVLVVEARASGLRIRWSQSMSQWIEEKRQ